VDEDHRRQSSDEEFDYVRDRISPRLEALLEKRGFLLLQWSDVG